jgi:hypothetical protein
VPMLSLVRLRLPERSGLAATKVLVSLRPNLSQRDDVCASGQSSLKRLFVAQG